MAWQWSGADLMLDWGLTLGSGQEQIFIGWLFGLLPGRPDPYFCLLSHHGVAGVGWAGEKATLLASLESILLSRLCNYQIHFCFWRRNTSIERPFRVMTKFLFSFASPCGIWLPVSHKTHLAKQQKKNLPIVLHHSLYRCITEMPIMTCIFFILDVVIFINFSYISSIT